MKIAVIDVGSNSVRLLLSENGKTLLKTNKITRLADGINSTGYLSTEAIICTAKAVAEYYDYAFFAGADKIFSFATAAVRKAKNSDEFLRRVKKICGLNVEVISGEEEAFFGAKGALNGDDGGVIDVGGASSEVIVYENGKIAYSQSLDIGAVVLTNMFCDDLVKLDKFLDKKLKEYGSVPKACFKAIGGTATSMASIILQMEVYDMEKIDGFCIEIAKLKELAYKLISMSESERMLLKGLQSKRAKVIGSGAFLLYKICDFLDIDKVIISERDNLEGFLLSRVEDSE